MAGTNADRLAAAQGKLNKIRNLGVGGSGFFALLFAIVPPLPFLMGASAIAAYQYYKGKMDDAVGADKGGDQVGFEKAMGAFGC